MACLGAQLPSAAQSRVSDFGIEGLDDAAFACGMGSNHPPLSWHMLRVMRA